MKQALLASFCVAMYGLGFLAHTAIVDARTQKAIEILHMPRVMFAGKPLGFGVRIRGAVDQDRFAFAMLCSVEGPCSLRELEHEKISYLPIEGSAAPRYWQVPPWVNVASGEYIAVAGLGAFDRIRVVSDQQSLIVQGM